jgi:hypothetical protein
MTNATHVLGSVATKVHPDLFCRFQWNNLSNIVEESCEDKLITATWLC